MKSYAEFQQYIQDIILLSERSILPDDSGGACEIIETKDIREIHKAASLIRHYEANKIQYFNFVTSTFPLPQRGKSK